MRLIHCNGVYAMEPGPDRKGDGAAAKRAGFWWHDLDSPRHERDCRACDARVPHRYWWTWSPEVAAKLYEQAAADPNQSPETLALLEPHRARGGEVYMGDSRLGEKDDDE